MRGELQQRTSEPAPASGDHERILLACRDGSLDFHLRRDEVIAAAERVLPRGRQGAVLVLGAARAALREMSACGEDADERRVRGELCVLLGRAQNALGHTRDAFETGYRTLFWLGRWAGGDEALERLMAHPSPAPVARLTVATLAVYGTALVEAPVEPATHARCVDEGRRLVAAYALSDGPHLHPATGALAGPWSILLAGDEPVVAALRGLTRPGRRARLEPAPHVAA